jgi:uncharacterized membrane protein
MKPQFETLLSKWQLEKIISNETAEKMQKDWNMLSAENAGNKWTVIISTLGALLLGIAAITFVASNWDELSRFQKIFLFVFLSFSSLFGGGYLLQKFENFSKTAYSLLFLSSLGFGATITLVFQLYHLGYDPYILLGLWTAGIVPIAYYFQSGAIFRLSIVTLSATLLLYLGNSTGLDIEDIFEALFESFAQIPFIFLLCTFFFALGTVHLAFEKLEYFGKILRLWAIKIFFFFLFWTTFPEIFEEISEGIAGFSSFSDWYFLKHILLALSAGGLLLYANRVWKQKIIVSEIFSLVGFGALALGLLAWITFSGPLEHVSGPSVLASFLLNGVFIYGILQVLFLAIKQQNLAAINFATFAIGAFLFGKYIQLFEDLLDSTAFFFVGGVILIGGGIFLEKKRKALIQKFLK